ncbi:helix-turn-helix domain-containing protein [Rubrobacter calidifluminis]|uniref:helix-turn-helix domain-containing protein n=1 Tax=Rubrobacter calidifluminis TaxID=1392640 RepID=UPI00235F6D2D|nr:helix-turn-helix domain-containing protein [Rubrobacter calidifluminis]
MERNGSIGERLAEIRRLKMWTQGRLAEEAGVSPTTVSGIETGRISNPHFGTVRKLARALGVDPRELLSPRGEQGSVMQPEASLEWALSAGEEEFERTLETFPLTDLERLLRELYDERRRLQELYGEFPVRSNQRWFIKRQIREVSARSGSIKTTIMFHHEARGGRVSGRTDNEG